MSSLTQPQLRLGDLEISLQMGHALRDSEATNCISKMKMKKQRLRCLKIAAYKCLRALLVTLHQMFHVPWKWFCQEQENGME